MKKSPMGLAASGTTAPQYVSLRPSWMMMKNSDTMSRLNGIIWVTSTPKKMRLLPRKRYFASA